eukprot:108613-Chlamydomonas_euryale.AAC.11
MAALDSGRAAGMSSSTRAAGTLPTLQARRSAVSPPNRLTATPLSHRTPPEPPVQAVAADRQHMMNAGRAA